MFEIKSSLGFKLGDKVDWIYPSPNYDVKGMEIVEIDLVTKPFAKCRTAEGRHLHLYLEQLVLVGAFRPSRTTLKFTVYTNV